MIDFLQRLIFNNRGIVIAFFVLATLVMLNAASQLKVDAGFEKLLPLEHEYMQNFVKHRETFGGANRILIALTVEEGDIFTPAFFDALKKATDEVFFISGVDRARVQSLVTPNTRFTEVVEEGIAGGNVVPADFQGSPEDLARVRENLLKSRYMGRLVSNDFQGALITAELLEIDPNTGFRLNYQAVATELEEKIRGKFDSDHADIKLQTNIDVHIIGFAKVIGDISEGALRVISFFAIALAITSLLVYFYTRSFKLTLIPIACSLIAVIWQLGALPMVGYGIDPMSILVPFLIFAIGVSHGVQMVSAVRAEIFLGHSSMDAAQRSFRRLLLPGGIALASDTIGFLAIMLIEIQIIQEMAITASLGVAAIILTNLILMPVLLSYVNLNDDYREALHQRGEKQQRIWHTIAGISNRGPAAIAIGIAIILLIVGGWKADTIHIGDLHQGVPELRSDSRYNIDSEIITTRFSIGVDVLSVFAETKAEGCIDHGIMTALDDFIWHVENLAGVQSVMALPPIAKRINAGWNEGALKWQVIPRHPQVLAQSVSPVDTSTGLLNNDCSVMPVLIFTEDHKATTISSIIHAIKLYRENHPEDGIDYALAGNNVGVMAATNEAVDEAQVPILVYVFAAVIILCLISFRTIGGMLAIVLPLALVSILAYALMSILDIGLKVSTLPVVALGVGVGVDYGIYIFSRLQGYLKEGMNLHDAYLKTLQVTGRSVVFTGITLAIGVATWIFSPLKFQADMGILLTFMFLVNMAGAILLLPALARWLIPSSAKGKSS